MSLVDVVKEERKERFIALLQSKGFQAKLKDFKIKYKNENCRVIFKHRPLEEAEDLLIAPDSYRITYAVASSPERITDEFRSHVFEKLNDGDEFVRLNINEKLYAIYGPGNRILWMKFSDDFIKEFFRAYDNNNQNKLKALLAKL